MNSNSNIRALLYGIEPALAGDLEDALGQLGVSSRNVGMEGQLPLGAEYRADVVFSASEPARVQPLLDAVRKLRSRLPVVVVSRTPEVSQWIDSLEAGADDYCCAPFEPAALRWILDATLCRGAQPA
jgi:DNA-binding response OmpR family regulator